jgi:peroxiredoxin
MSASRLLRAAALVAAVAAVAAAGLWAGRLARGPARVVPTAAPSPGFEAGEGFPSVPVLTEDRAPLATADLIAPGGAVVLFLDFECSPCATMVSRWEEHLASDSLRGVRLFGVTHFAPEAVREYRASHGVTFPIYSDTAAAFVRVHGVNDFPLCVVVDGAGTVRWVTFDPNAEVPARDIRGWVVP